MLVDDTTSSDNNVKQKRLSQVLEFGKFTLFFVFVSTLQYFLNMLAGVFILGRINVQYMHGIGSVVLSLGSLYGLLGFLRMATVGFSAKAKYLNDDEYAWASFFESAVLALVIGIIFIVLQKIVFQGSMVSYKLEGEVVGVASDYFYVVIWSSPIHLLNFVITGWLMGRGVVVRVFVMQLICTALNIGLSIFLGLNIGLGARGIGIAMALSQVIMCAIGVVFILSILPKHTISFNKTVFADNRKKMLAIDSHLILRFVFLTIQIQINNILVARLGGSYISASNILMNFVFISSGMFEGIGNAASAFAGRSMAEKNSALLRSTWNMTNIFTIAMSVVICIIYIAIRTPFIESIASSASSRQLSLDYSLWLIPCFLVGGFSMSYFGIFLGTTFTKPIATSSFMALVTFIFVYNGIRDIVVQNGYSVFIAIWIAYIVFYLIRSLGLFLYNRKLLDILDD